MVNKSELKPSGLRPFPGKGEYMLFNSDIVNLLLKTSVGREKA